MTLENFQGIRQAEYRLDGRNADFYGDNATGKTTLFNAFTWLLFGRPSTGSVGYTPKTKTADGDAHNLNHSVECEMEINGEVVVFKRVYYEDWGKTRGKAVEEFRGNLTDYFIDGVPKKEKEYKKYWEGIFENEELPKLLSMPFYFPETLHWEKRRAILLEICGIIADGEIMESDEELKDLPALLGSKTVDEYKKVVKASLAEINKTMQSIPARIDEAEKAIPTVLATDYADTALAEVREKITTAEKERAGILANDNSAAVARKTITELETQLSEARRIHSEKGQAENAGAFETVRALREKVTNAQGDLNNMKLNRDKSAGEVAVIEKIRSEIFAGHREKQDTYDRVQAEIFDEAATVCVTCQQDLPIEKADELREAFNVRKSNRLNELTEQMNALVERGKREASKEMLAAAQQAVSNAENGIALLQANSDELVTRLNEAESKQKSSALPPFEQTSEYRAIFDKINAAKSNEAQGAPDTSAVDIKLADLRNEEKSLTEAKAANETARVQRERIAELEKQEQELGVAYENAQHALYLCERFSRVKASLLTDKINDRFQSVSFQLFKKNITNDGIDDVCEVMIPTEDGKRVPFKDANNAARINAGLEIIGVLGEHYGVVLPVFVDNAESVTRIIPISGQLIRLIVSENDKALRLELN
jgi:hypothetical protein